MDTQEQNNQNQSSESHNNSTQSTPSNETLMGILSYIGPLVIVSYLSGKDNDFIKFHAKQGILVFGLEVVVWLLSGMLYSMWMISGILNLATLVLSIIGIVNVVQGNKKELPVVGKYASSLNL